MAKKVVRVDMRMSKSEDKAMRIIGKDMDYDKSMATRAALLLMLRVKGRKDLAEEVEKDLPKGVVDYVNRELEKYRTLREWDDETKKA